MPPTLPLTEYFRDKVRRALSSRSSLSYMENSYPKTQDLDLKKNEVLSLAGKCMQRETILIG